MNCPKCNTEMKVIDGKYAIETIDGKNHLYRVVKHRCRNAVCGNQEIYTEKIELELEETENV